MSTQYKTYCRYASLATRLEQGTVSADLVRQEVGACGLAAILAYLAAGKPDFHTCQEAGFSF